MNQEAISNLRAAIELSPENLPLRFIFAQALMSANRYEEAETEYKLILVTDHNNHSARTGLAKALYQQKKFSVAYVVLEEICKLPATAAEFHVLYSRLLLQENQKEEAARQYGMALQKDAGIADLELDKQFRIRKPISSHDPRDGSVDVAETDLSGNSDTENAETPDITFADVGGMEFLKEEIRVKIVYPRLFPDLYKAYDKKAGGGILLYGPPGCGKTYIARAAAGEMKARFISVGISDIMDSYVGASERNLHKAFMSARRRTPSVLFFDEMDALGASRHDMKSSTGRQLINQFLTEMDGIEGNNEGVLVLAATNTPWAIDSAFRRPGRFGELVFVPPPDIQARVEILNLHLRGKPTKDIDVKELAEQTKQWSGADLRGMLDRTVEEKLRASFKSGVPQLITQNDLLKIIHKTQPTTQEWFSVAENYATFSNQAGAYDGVLNYIKKNK